MFLRCSSHKGYVGDSCLFHLEKEQTLAVLSVSVKTPSRICAVASDIVMLSAHTPAHVRYGSASSPARRQSCAAGS